MQRKISLEEQHVTNSTINTMLDVLNNKLKKDNILANELLSFLSEHNIEIPTLSSNDLKNLIPVSYKHKNQAHQIGKLKTSFEGIETTEFVL